MTKRLLIDARQSEETRVVLLSGTRIEDFDYETENRKQLKGTLGAPKDAPRERKRALAIIGAASTGVRRG